MKKIRSKEKELHTYLTQNYGFDEEILTADGFAEAFICVAYIANDHHVVVYDKNKCIKILMKKQHMGFEDAIEFFNYNVAGAYVGPHTPLFIDPTECKSVDPTVY